MRYSELVEAVYKYRLETRFEVITYFMGLHGEVTQADYDMVQKLYDDLHIGA